MFEIGARIALYGEKEFKSAQARINAELRELKSELNLVSARYADNADSMEALSAKSAVLSKQYEKQKEKVSVLEAAHKKAGDEQERVRKSVEKYEAELASAREELARMEKSQDSTSDAIKNQKAHVKNLEEQLLGTQREYDKASKCTLRWQESLNNAQTEEIRLKRAVEDCGKAMEEAEQRTQEASDETQGFRIHIEQAEKQTSTFGEVLKANLTSAAIIEGIKALARETKQLAESVFQTGMEYESAFTGVKKTVNATEEELSTMRQEFLTMSEEIPASASAIAEVAESAGQLGIQTEHITEFSRVMIDLGNATDLASTEASESLAQFANVVGMSQGDFDRLGSVIVDLGNNTATTESHIVAMGTRIAAAGHQVNMSEAQIMAFSAGLSSLGLEAEAGGTAFSKLMINMQVACETGNQSLTDFASVAGMSAEQFKIAFQQDATGAIMAFLQGLNDTERNGMSAISVLNNMDIKEVRLRDTILRAASATDLMNNCIEIGNQAWQANNALTTEAETRYATTESKVQMLKNSVQECAISAYDQMRNGFAKGIDIARDGVTNFNDEIRSGKIGNSLQKLGESFADLAKAAVDVGEVAIPLVCDAFAWIVDHGSGVLSVIAGVAAGFAAYKAYTVVISAVNAFKSMQAAIEAAEVAQMALNLEMSLNPIGLIVAGAAALITVFGVLAATTGEVSNEFTEQADALRSSSEELNNYSDALSNNLDKRKEERDSIESNTVAIESYKTHLLDLMAKEEKSAGDKKMIAAYVDALNQSVEGLNLAYDANTDALNMNEQAMESYIRTAIQQRKTEILVEQLAQSEIDLAEASQKVKEAEDALAETEKSHEEVQESLNEEIAKSGYVRSAWTPKARELEATEEELTEAIDAQQEALDNANEVYAQAQEENARLCEMLGVTSTAMEETDSATQELTESTFEWKGKTIEASESLMQELGSVQAAYVEALGEARESIDGQIGLFDELSLKSELSVSDMIKSMQSQAEAMDQWAENLRIAAEMGIDEGLLASLNDGTVESAQYLNEIVQNGQDSVDELNAAWRRTQDGKDNLAAGMAEVSTAYSATMDSIVDAAEQQASSGGKDVGKALADGTAGGINANAIVAVSAVKEMISNVTAGAKLAAGIHSPSRVFKTLGGYLDEGLAVGIADKAELAVDAAENLMDQTTVAAHFQTDRVAGYSENGYAKANGTGATGGSVGNITINFTPKQMTPDEMDRCFNYINHRFAVAIP
ncbi:MAG: phage tail tape measure protein [Lachnospiraceae bacterium]|nr:phage tail tape measure protein [Lachnospiraceae bacterium]